MADHATAHGLATDRTIGFMNGLDALFLYLESPETPMHVGSMHLFALPGRWRGDFAADVRAHLAARLDRADVLTRRLAPMPLRIANPAWVRAAEVDLDHHVRRVRLPAPGTLAQLHELVASLHAQLLDRDRPLWEMVVVEGLESGHIGFYAKVHHAGLDGQAGVALAQAVYETAARAVDATPADPPAPHARRAEPGRMSVATAGMRHNVALLADIGARVPAVARSIASAVRRSTRGADGAALALASGAAGVRGALRTLGALVGDAGLLAPRTPFNVAISRHRAFATVSVPIERARAIAQAHDATLNDVVLAACGGALRDWLQARDALPATPLLAAVPVSLRRPGDARSNTQATMVRLPLATHLHDPVERLERIRDASARLKGAMRDVKGALPTEFPSIGLPWLGSALAALWRRPGIANRLPPIANLVVSNVPGPTAPLHLVGARMLGNWPISIPVHAMALNVTVQSYAGSLDFGLVACRRAVPDVDAIAAGIAAAFDALSAGEGAAADPRPRETPIQAGRVTADGRTRSAKPRSARLRSAEPRPSRPSGVRPVKAARG